MKWSDFAQRWREDISPVVGRLLSMGAIGLAIWAVIKWQLWIWFILIAMVTWLAIRTPFTHRLNNEVTVWPIQRFTSAEVDVLESQNEKTYRVIPERQEVIEMGNLGLMRLEGCTVADRLNWECSKGPMGYGRAMKMVDGMLAESQSDDDPDAAFSLLATRYGYRICPGETRYVSVWLWLRLHTNPHVRSSSADRAECAVPISSRGTINALDTQY